MSDSTTNVTIRMTMAQKIDLQNRSEGNVSDYVKKRLFGDPDNSAELLERLANIESLLENRTGDRDGSSALENGRDRYIEAMMIEILLVLRSVSKPEHSKAAGHEIKRIGLEPWSSDLAIEREN
ncbi:TPA: hypothetical protein MN540_005060 [Klebsiella pneumoniae]|nr:hypothetical protein [Klebsiella pneumoniae]